MTTRAPEMLRVMLIDDDPGDRLLADIAFEKHDRLVEATLLSKGADALDAMRAPGADLPDVVILDLNMPGMTGFEVIQEIRSDATLRHLPIVILSTSDHASDIALAYDLLVSSYLVKSQDFPSFMEQIDHFVQYWHMCRFALK